jgi:hypothetical protein
MANRTSGAPAPAGTIDDAFLDIICQDEELLRAEFDALVAASWDEPPPPPRPPAVPRPADNPAPQPATRTTTAQEIPSRSHHPAPAGRRQRSPPAGVRS